MKLGKIDKAQESMTMIHFNASECMMEKLGFKAERKTQILQNVWIWGFPV